MLMGAKSKMLALHNSFILFYCYSLGPYSQLGFGGAGHGIVFMHPPSLILVINDFR